MPPNSFASLPMDQLDDAGTNPPVDWLRDALGAHRDLLADWTPDPARPWPSVLYDWPNRAVAAGLVHHSGSGTRSEPDCYRLVTEGDVPGECGEQQRRMLAASWWR